MTREVLQELSRPRLFGTAGATSVGQLLEDRLERLGLRVERRTFEFSTWPGRNAVPALGAFLTAVFLVAAALLSLGLTGPPAVLLVLVTAALLPVPVLAGVAVERFPAGRAEGANILASRPGRDARFLVVAHRDSKSQPVPLGLRIAGAALIVYALPATSVAAAAGAAGWAAAFASIGLAGAVVLIFCAAGNGSPGALDNATGLVALLELASTETSDDVAFLVTDAEELGLAGARAVAPELAALDAVINLDGLDDDGPVRLLTGRGRAAGRNARGLRDALAQAVRDHGATVRTHGVPVGLLVDHLPFAAAGVPAVTVMRGHLGALARVHTPADSADRLTGAGAAETARIVALALATLRAQIT